MQLIQHISLQNNKLFILVNLLLLLVSTDAGIIRKRDIITLERSSKDDLKENETLTSHSSIDTTPISLTTQLSSPSIDQVVNATFITDNGSDIRSTILPLNKSNKVGHRDNRMLENNENPKTPFTIMERATTLSNRNNKHNSISTKEIKQSITIKLNEYMTTSFSNDINSSIMTSTTVGTSDDTTDGNIEPNVYIINDSPKDSTNYDIATNEIRNLTTPTKRGKFIKNDSANTNDLTLPGNVDAWALAAMNDKKHLGNENTMKINNAIEVQNFTSSIKVLNDWSGIMKNVDVFNVSGANSKLSKDKLVKKDTQLPLLNNRKQTSEITSSEVANKSLSKETSIVTTMKMLQDLKNNMEIMPELMQEITTGTPLQNTFITNSSGALLNVSSTILKLVNATTTLVPFIVKNNEANLNPLLSDNTNGTFIELSDKTQQLKGEFVSFGESNVFFMDDKQNVNYTVEKNYLDTVENTENNSSKIEQTPPPVTTSFTLLVTTNLPETTITMLSNELQNKIGGGSTEKLFPTTVNELTDVTPLNNIGETSTNLMENSSIDAFLENSLEKDNSLFLKNTSSDITDFTESSMDTVNPSNKTDVSDDAKSTLTFETTQIPNTSLTIVSITSTIINPTSYISTLTPTITTESPQNDFKTTLMPIQENSIERFSETTTESSGNLTVTPIVLGTSFTIPTTINDHSVYNAMDASTPQTISTTKNEKELEGQLNYATPFTLLSPKLTETTTNSDIFEMTFPPNDQEELDHPETDYNVIIAISVSVVGVIALILLVGFLYVMRKRQKQMSYGQRCRPVSLDAYSLDNVSVFNSVRRKGVLRTSKRSYGNVGFDDPSLKHNVLGTHELAKFIERKFAIAEEFKDVPQIIARADEVPAGCEDKNRYANVVPLPETRVILQRQNGDEKTEYINANYVQGPKDTPNYYIATQGPLESTLVDFWRMIWEQNSRVIIMVTDLIENGIEKCAEYLPPSVTLDNHTVFGDVQVTLKNRDVKDKYAVSTLLIRNVKSNKTREMTHFWYQWPETGVPSEEAGVIAMLLEARSSLKVYGAEQFDERVQPVAESFRQNGSTVNKSSKSQSKHQGPLTIHCSNGTGRSGTIIACDIAIRSLETPKRVVDIPQIVYYVRRGRASAIQTKEQYEFIYRVTHIYATKIAGPINDN